MYKANSKADRFKLLGILAITLMFTIIKAVRLPNDFAEGQWLMSYQFGFIKRGLPGTLLRLTGLTDDPDTAFMVIQIVSIALFAIFIFAVLLVILRMIERTGWSIPLFMMCVLFVTSSFIVQTSNLVGYFDHILYVLTIIALLFVVHRQDYLIAGVILGISLFIHETVLIIGLPIILLAMLIKGEQRITRYMLVIIPSIVAFLFIAWSQYTLDTQRITEQFIQYLSAFDFLEVSMEIRIPQEVITTTFSSYLGTELANFPLYLLGFPVAIARTLPFVLMTLVFIHFTYGHRLTKWQLPLISATIFAPLVLLALAWDVERIWYYLIWHCFLILWVLNELLEAREMKPQHLVTPFLILLMTHMLGVTLLIQDHEQETLTALQTLALITVLPLGWSVSGFNAYVLDAYIARSEENTAGYLFFRRLVSIILIGLSIAGVILVVMRFALSDDEQYAINDFLIYPLTAETIPWQEFRDKPVIIHFWDTACEPCIDEIPILLRIYDENADEIFVLSVNLSEPWNAIDEWVDDFGLDFPVDQSSRLAGNENADYEPETFIFDPEGELIAQLDSPISEQQVRDIIAPYLSDE